MILSAFDIKLIAERTSDLRAEFREVQHSYKILVFIVNFLDS